MERYVLGDKVTEDKSSVQAQYNKLELTRETYLARARDCAKLTIPTLFPDQSVNEATEYKCPYQSVGARGVMNLASKLPLNKVYQELKNQSWITWKFPMIELQFMKP